MDRSLSSIQDGGGQDFDLEGFVLPSRSSALAAGMGALNQGLVLISGEPGAGKTWLGSRLRSSTPSSWITVEIFPSMTAAEFFGEMGRALGAGSACLRAEVFSLMAEQAAEGRSVSLLIEESQLASVELLEEIRLLSNRQGKADGFSAIVLIGQTKLSLRLDAWTLRAIESRIAARIHLRPLDVDEASTLLDQMSGGASWNRERVEALHRDASGNPRRLLQLARSIAPSRASIATRQAPRPTPSSIPSPSSAPVPIVVGPSKPPLRMEEGLIEVGYDSVYDSDEPIVVGPHAPATSVDGDEQPIVDHYAALQAWDEWARNQGREPADSPYLDEGDMEMLSDAGAAEEPLEAASSYQSWGEHAQDFAPYSQLFSRVKPTAEAEAE